MGTLKENMDGDNDPLIMGISPRNDDSDIVIDIQMPSFGNVCPKVQKELNRKATNGKPKRNLSTFRENKRSMFRLDTNYI